MLIVPSPQDLGDIKLNEVENLAKLREGNAKLAEKYKLPGQEILENQDMARGTPMDWKELIRKLSLASDKLLFWEGGAPNSVQVRIANPNPTPEEWEPDTLYVTGFTKDILTEFTWATPDSHGLISASGLHRGWRDVVKQLIQQGLISYTTAVLIFGDAEGTRSMRWHEQLQGKK